MATLVRMLIAGVLIAGSSAHAAVLDWTQVNWTSGALTGTFDVGTGADARRIEITVTGATNRIVNAANQAGGSYADPASINEVHYLQGNLSNAQYNGTLAAPYNNPAEVLFIKLDGMTSTEVLTITFRFLDVPGNGNLNAVRGVNIPIFDIDAAPPGTYIDQVQVSARNGAGGTDFYPGRTTFANNTLSGTAGTTTAGIQGTSAAEQSGAGSAGGTGIFDFGNNTLTQFSVEYRNVQTGGGGGGIQWIGISNITFTPVPEPSTFVLLGTVAVGSMGYLWRRRRSRVA